MTRILLAMSASLLGLSACAGRSAAQPAASLPAAFTAALRLGDPVPATAPPRAQGPAAAEMMEVGNARSDRRDSSAPVARVDSANRAAVREPTDRNYVNASQVYAWTEGALYRLYAAPEQVSDIALQPGEHLISVAAGDTLRWVIGDTVSGTGANRRTHILVKPSASGLRTNLVIATDRRAYHVQLESTARTAMASMSWSYPQDDLLALDRAQAAAAAVVPVADGVSLDALNFNYRIEGDEPRWRPVRAFDDGQQVFIEFPPDLAVGEAPPLFVTGAAGGAELVNYRVRGHYYVVDRLFDVAELRLGERRQQVVRIKRSYASLPRRRRSRSS